MNIPQTPYVPCERTTGLAHTSTPPAPFRALTRKLRALWGVPDRVWLDNAGEWRQAFPQWVEDAGLLAWIGGVVCLGAWLMGVAR